MPEREEWPCQRVGWWERSGRTVKVPSVRWLGLFKRSLRLDLRHPGVVQVPHLIVGESVTATCAGLRRGAASISGLPLYGDARSIHTGLLTLECATVHIKDVDLAAFGIPRQGHDSIRRGEMPGPAVPTRELPDGLSLSQRLAYLLKAPVTVLTSPQGPLEWPGTLFSYQLEGVEALVSRDCLLLADDMGLGKTVQTLAALRVLMLQRRMEKALLVVPLAVLSQWRRELKKWAPELRVSTVHGPSQERAWQWRAPAHVYLTSYEALRSDLTDNPEAPVGRSVWDVMIIDEAQRIKNRSSELSRTCKRVPRKRAWALTGTPLENKEDDLGACPSNGF